MRTILTRRRLCFLFAIILGLFLLNLVLIFNYLDLKRSIKTQFNATGDTNFMGHKTADCPISDPLAISALDRMKTPECRDRLRKFVCEIGDKVWPVEAVENTCDRIFDPGKSNKYIGCFHDTISSRLLDDFKFNFSRENSPEACVQACLRAGFKYAGVEFKVECFCGDQFDGNRSKNRTIDDSKCQRYNCPGANGASFCGGYEAIAVYSTGAKAKNAGILRGDLRRPNGENIPRVKILFLLQLNGRNVRQIRRLLKLIYRSEHFYYIHVDSRQEYLFKEMKKLQKSVEISGAANFHVASERLATIWGGTSLLDLFLGVIRNTVDGRFGQSWRAWDYMLNLSEADMPLLGVEELERLLGGNLGTSFLSSHGYNTGSFLKKQGYNFYFMECERRMWRIFNRPNYPRNLRLDGGSDWVIVHRDLAEFAISDSKFPSQLRPLFSTILLPLESFFHTLALNSHFCSSVHYSNLRLTNWRRKQGCRCAALKPVVDWCGCSPLAFYAEDVRLDAERCRAKLHFFGRKFDALVDAGAIARVEATVRANHSEEISQSVAYNSTWVNVFELEADGSRVAPSRLALLREFARSVVSISSPKIAACDFNELREIFIFKANDSSPIQGIMGLELRCQNGEQLIFEFLLTPNNLARTFHTDSTVIFYDGIGFLLANPPEFGIGLDLKEEIFRDFPPIVDTSPDSPPITVIWRWDQVLPLSDEHKSAAAPKLNFTSPPIGVKLFNPSGHFVHFQTVKAYDSINGAQFIELKMADFEGAINGTWKFVLVSSANSSTEQSAAVLAELQFPVFPLGNIPFEHRQRFDQLTIRHFEILAICARSSAAVAENFDLPVPKCVESSWSSVFRDEKSEFAIEED